MQVKPKSSRLWLKITVLALVVLIVIAGIFITQAVSIMNDAFLRDADGDAAKAEIERLMGSTLPASANDFNFYSRAFVADSYDAQARFSIAAEDFPALLSEAQNLCFETPLETGGAVTIPRNFNAEWWTPPNGAQTALSAACSVSSFDYEILVDTSNAQTWIVYLSVT